MKRLHFSRKLFSDAYRSLFTVLAATLLMFVIGRDMLGEAVIALLYLVPIVWCANRWGQFAGTSAALVAALMFDFFFIPPLYTFDVGRLEGWLVLVIFLGVAIVVVGYIESSLQAAKESVLMYDLSDALTGLRSQDAVARTCGRFFRMFLLASQVRVIYHPKKDAPDIVITEPQEEIENRTPDLQIPILNVWGLIGEIQIWADSDIHLPTNDSRLLKNFAAQIGKAFERTQLYE